jgi:protein tyrosine/serine phosphatase
MTLRRPSRVTKGLLVVVVAIGVATAGDELRRALSHTDEKFSLEGVSNFGRMNDRLYRGAQPTTAGYTALRDLGIDTIVRLSLGEEGSSAEESQVKALGMGYVSLPWSTQHEPSREQVATFLTLLRAHPRSKVFVHCKWGADRTGVMIALSRIAIDHWTVTQAIAEMNAFHYHYLFLPHLQRYVEAFPAALASEPAFRDVAMDRPEL